LALLTGCADTKSRASDVLLLRLAGLLPGHYDNVAQVDADVRAGRQPHEAVSVVITPVNSLTVGEYAFHWMQTGATDSARVNEQQVFALQAAKEGVVQTVWSLVDPQRWRGGVTDPRLFSALQYSDLKRINGCALIWKQDGERLTATNDMRTCHETPPQAREAVFARWDIEVTADQLSIATRAYDADGKEVGGRADEPFLRLRRRGN
jgi:hypothetical protein